MRPTERQRLAQEKAAAVMPSALFQIFANAIRSRSAVVFDYTDRFGVSSHREEIYPEGFLEFPASDIFPGSVNVWAYHTLHRHKEQYNVLRIAGARRLITLIDALLDMATNAEYWSGPKPEEKVVSIFDQLRQSINALTDIPDKDQLILDWLRQNLPSATTPVAGPSTSIVHEAYTTYVDGIPIYFDSLEDSVVTLAREIISGSPLPSLLKEMIVGIQIVEEDAPGGPDVIGMSADGFITIYGNRQVDPGVIAHEAAHDFAVGKWGNPIPSEDSDYVAAINSGEPPVSEYSLRNSSEDFAESIRMFVDNPTEMKKIAPLRYQVIERLMTEKGYGG